MARLPRYLAILCVLFLTSGCFGNDVVIEVLPQPTEVLIPAQNRTCPAIPTPPNPDFATQQDVAAWLPDVYAVHAECRSDLRSSVRIVDAHNQEAQRIAAENAAKVAAAE